MERKEFKRCSPEYVGIPSSAIQHLVDRLEYGGFTEIHSLMIMRDDMICAEGWWAPYVPASHHALHSLSKTWTATAVGLAEYAGLLKVTDRVCDLLPELMPDPLPDRVSRITVRDLLTMSSGCTSEQEGFEQGWKKEFFSRPFEHEPGTFWFYNTHGTAILSAVVEKVTGMDMIDWLDARLFRIIGVDRRRVMCRRDQEGTCLGGHGMFTTTEDNLRLMRLYLHKGEWDDSRLLSETFVRDATSPLLDTAPAHADMPWVHDNRCGYGYQIWMCRPEGSYRADGAYGQFAVVVPELNLIVSITEAAYIGKKVTQNQLNRKTNVLPVEPDHPVHGPQSTLDALFDILIPAIEPDIRELPPSTDARILRERMCRLAIPHPAGWTDAGPARELDVTLVPAGPGISFCMLQGMGKHNRDTSGAALIHLKATADALLVSAAEGKEERQFAADMRGGRTSGKLVYKDNGEVCTEIASAAWWAGDTLELSVLWTETENHNRYSFTFDGDTVRIHKWMEAGIADPLTECDAVYRIGGQV